MKKIAIIACVILGISQFYVSDVYAGQKEWARAGKVLTGIIGLNILSNAIHDSTQMRYEHAYSSRRYHNGYNNKNERHCKRQREWVAGYYQTVREDIWVPTETRKIWVESRYKIKCHHGRKEHIKVRDGYYRYKTIPGHYETVEKKIWVEGWWRYQ